MTRGTVVAADIELAATFWTRFRGLMGRPALEPGGGLWLTGTSSIHMLFMRFAIDAIFLGPACPDGSRRVVAVRPTLRPWLGVVWWARGAEVCLEVTAGAAEAAGVEVGDAIEVGPG